MSGGVTLTYDRLVDLGPTGGAALNDMVQLDARFRDDGVVRAAPGTYVTLTTLGDAIYVQFEATPSAAQVARVEEIMHNEYVENPAFDDAGVDLAYQGGSATSVAIWATTFTTVQDTEVTLGAGSYHVHFSSTAAQSRHGDDVTYAIFVDDVEQPLSRRYLGWIGGTGTRDYRTVVHTTAVLQLANPSQDVCVKLRSGGTGTTTIYNRSFVFTNVG